jgi:hypothetical protein
MEEERQWERQKKPYGAETQFFFLSNRYEYFIQLKRERESAKEEKEKQVWWTYYHHLTICLIDTKDIALKVWNSKRKKERKKKNVKFSMESLCWSTTQCCRQCKCKKKRSMSQCIYIYGT